MASGGECLVRGVSLGVVSPCRSDGVEGGVAAARVVFVGARRPPRADIAYVGARRAAGMARAVRPWVPAAEQRQAQAVPSTQWEYARVKPKDQSFNTLAHSFSSVIDQPNSRNP